VCLVSRAKITINNETWFNACVTKKRSIVEGLGDVQDRGRGVEEQYTNLECWGLYHEEVQDGITAGGMNSG
jgi:hypothetical protein